MAVCFSAGYSTIPWKARAVRRKLLRMNENPMNENPARNDSSDCRRVLGVDPAAAGPTGYGIIESDGKKCRVLHYGALRVGAKRQKASAGATLHDVHALLCELLERFQPHAMAVESVFTALNMKTALRLAEVRGVVLLAAEQHGVTVHSYAPREVKACVAGYGHADKKQMQLMVRALLAMKETPVPSDAADALAVALCHLQAEQFERRFGVQPGAVAKGNSQPTRKTATPKVTATEATGLRIQSIR
jgi:crossover junction endodeoxyribonuclease RuvC